MIDVKVTTTAPAWPWKRQTPGGGSTWGPFRFHIDDACARADAWIVFESLPCEATVVCPPERTIFVSGEPTSIAGYLPEFLAQFGLVVSSVEGIRHPRLMRMQQGHPWFVEKSYDELVSMQPPEKTHQLCVISSAKSFTPGHARRLQFVNYLQRELPDVADIYGRGMRDFGSKWDLLSRYRYTVVLENTDEADFLTEKLPDAWLAFCFPFYHGCRNVSRYYPPGAHEVLDLDRPADAVRLIRDVIDTPGHYQSVLDAIRTRRRSYLDTYQFFPNAAAILQTVLSAPATSARSTTLLPNGRFAADRERSWLSRAARGVMRRHQG